MLLGREIKIVDWKLSRVCVVLGLCCGPGSAGSHPGTLLWRIGEEVAHEHLANMVSCPLLPGGRAGRVHGVLTMGFWDKLNQVEPVPLEIPASLSLPPLETPSNLSLPSPTLTPASLSLPLLSPPPQRPLPD